MRKILVTGANGFVGAELCRTLMARKIPVIGTIRRKAVSSFEFQIGNLDEATNWSDALLDCDVVIHLAARVHIMKDDNNDPLAAYRKVNVDATINLAKQAAESGVQRFIFVSSVKVNGEITDDHPFTGSDVPNPVDPYGQSKFEAECALRELSQHTGMELVIVRPPLVYGPNVRANFLKLMKLIKLGLPLPLGKIKNHRSMIALDNLVDLLILCTEHPRAGGQIFMASDGEDLSISELVSRIAQAMGRNVILLPLPSKMIEICAGLIGKTAITDRLLGSLQVDISQSREMLNWTPPVSVDMAIKKTVSYFLE